MFGYVPALRAAVPLLPRKAICEWKITLILLELQWKSRRWRLKKNRILTLCRFTQTDRRAGANAPNGVRHSHACVREVVWGNWSTREVQDIQAWTNKKMMQWEEKAKAAGWQWEEMRWDVMHEKKDGPLGIQEVSEWDGTTGRRHDDRKGQKQSTWWWGTQLGRSTDNRYQERKAGGRKDDADGSLRKMRWGERCAAACWWIGWEECENTLYVAYRDDEYSVVTGENSRRAQMINKGGSRLLWLVTRIKRMFVVRIVQSRLGGRDEDVSIPCGMLPMLSHRWVHSGTFQGDLLG